MVAQHPNLDNIPQIFSFNYKSLTPYAGLNDTAGPFGNVQSEILFRKDQATFTFEKGWAFPRRIYFNGDNCVMPPPDTYPFLPNGGFRQQFSVFSAVLLPVLLFFLFST
ncbi:protein COBRA-like isoform X2 [Brassica napus]|uniref:protein COBRA-like isoform X2 n=1 Tax=Brassica napus TaxID=3708 RepID=UPI002078A350|nr:protein COBRA-like isoform X2 [Brassica napus]XP_048604360.1 protein COBRA-like isoform X2 [Brassica napus]